VQGLDPTFSDVIEVKRKEVANAARDVVSLQVRLFDEIIQRLKSGYVC